MLAVHRRPALPGMILGRIHPRLLQKLLVEMAIGAFERAHEGALLRPTLPFGVLDRVGVFRRRLVVAEPGDFVFQHSGHSAIPVLSLRRAAAALPVKRISLALRAARLSDFCYARNVVTGAKTRARQIPSIRHPARAAARKQPIRSQAGAVAQARKLRPDHVFGDAAPTGRGIKPAIGSRQYP